MNIEAGAQAFTKLKNAIANPISGIVNLGSTLMFRYVLNLIKGNSQTFQLTSDVHTIKLSFRPIYHASTPQRLRTPYDFIHLSEGINDIFSFLQKLGVCHLDLADADVDDTIGLKILEFVKSNPNIKRVTLTNNPKLSKELFEDIMHNVNSVENMIATFKVMTDMRAEKIKAIKKKMTEKSSKEHQKDFKEYFFKNPKDESDFFLTLRKNICFLPSELQEKILNYTSPLKEVRQEDVMQAEAHLKKVFSEEEQDSVKRNSL